jgi:hypothetical protein
MKTVGYIAGMSVIIAIGVIATNLVINTVTAVATKTANGSS